MRSVAIRLGLLLLGVVPASAQMLPPVGKKGAALTDDAEMHVRAEVQERVAKGHYRFHGFVDIVAGDLRVQANEVDLFEEEGPDGKLHRRAEATGEVVFFQGDQRLSGTSGTLDLDTGKGRILHARGFLDPGVFVEADEIDRISAKVYRIKGGTFSSCYQPHPRWSFTARSAKVKLGSHLLATLVDFHVLDVPTPIFLPVFYYPLHEDQRSTGFLFPQVSTGGIRGFGVSSGFFWAMGRSFDQTVTVEHFAQLGLGLGHEFRYMLASPSGGTFRTYALRHDDVGNWDYDLQWDAAQALPAQFTARLSVHQNSDTTFQQQIQTNIDLALSRTEQASLSVSRHFGFGNLLFQASRDSTFYSVSNETTQHEYLPSLRLSQRGLRIGHTKFNLGYDLSAEQLGLGNGDTTVRYSRFDGSTNLTLPLATSFLEFTPRFVARYRRWGGQQATDGFHPDSLEQSYLEGSLGIVGPKFSRVFLNEGGFYSDKLKHEIHPEATFTYRSRIENFLEIPKFDGQDYGPAAGAGQIDYGLVQTFVAKRPGPDGKPRNQEFLNWSIRQSYYSDVNASQYDPNFQSADFNPAVPSLTPTPAPYTFRHSSAVKSRIRFQPVTELGANANLEYDVYAHALRRIGFDAQAAQSLFSVHVGWDRSTQFDEQGNPTVVSNTVQTGGQLKLIPDKVALAGETYFDLTRAPGDKLLNANASLRYDVQCCGFIVDYHYRSAAVLGKKDSGLSFRIQLANIGSASGFHNQDAFGPQGVGYGGRP